MELDCSNILFPSYYISPRDLRGWVCELPQTCLLDIGWWVPIAFTIGWRVTIAFDVLLVLTSPSLAVPMGAGSAPVRTLGGVRTNFSNTLLDPDNDVMAGIPFGLVAPVASAALLSPGSGISIFPMIMFRSFTNNAPCKV
jgi:hypothetical protein